MTPQRLTMAVFFLQPIAFGAWLPRIPDVQHTLGLGPAALALGLLGLPVGTLLTLPFAGPLVGRIGARKAIIFGFVAFLLAIMLPAWSPNGLVLFAVLALVGSSMSTLELGLNVMADSVEKATGSVLMSTCHGFWSLGVMIGSVIGSALAVAGISAALAIMGVALACLPVALFVAGLLPELGAGERPGDKPQARGRALPGPVLLGICLFTFGITMTEGAVADWSAVFLRDVFGAASGQAGIGYSVFAMMVAGGRFCGDWLKLRLGAVPLARTCGALAIAGLLVVLASPDPTLAIIGFGLIGLGASVGFPLAVSAAASLTDRPAASSVAILSFLALTGFLIGPPMIGFVAELTGMRWGLGMLFPVLCMSLMLAGMLRPKRAE